MAEETLYDSEAMRRIAGIELGDDCIPDETTIYQPAGHVYMPERPELPAPSGAARADGGDLCRCERASGGQGDHPAVGDLGGRAGGPEATKSAAKNPFRTCQADQAAISTQPKALIRRSLTGMSQLCTAGKGAVGEGSKHLLRPRKPEWVSSLPMAAFNRLLKKDFRSAT